MVRAISWVKVSGERDQTKSAFSSNPPDRPKAPPIMKAISEWLFCKRESFSDRPSEERLWPDLSKATRKQSRADLSARRFFDSWMIHSAAVLFLTGGIIFMLYFTKWLRRSRYSASVACQIGLLVLSTNKKVKRIDLFCKNRGEHGWKSSWIGKYVVWQARNYNNPFFFK